MFGKINKTITLSLHLCVDDDDDDDEEEEEDKEDSRLGSRFGITFDISL